MVDFKSKPKKDKKDLRGRDGGFREALSAEEQPVVSSEKLNREDIEVLEAAQIYRQGVTSIMDLIAPSAMAVESRHVDLGGKLLSTIYVVTYPRYISVGWFAPIILMNAELDISMFFYPVKAEVILKQLKNKVGTLEAQIMSDREKGAPRDPIRETALSDIEQLRDSLTQGTEKFFQYALYITAYADNEKALDDRMEEMDGLLGSRLVVGKRVFYQAEQGFNSTIPIGEDELGIYFNMNSSPCASSFPFISSDLTSDDGIMYGVNRHNGSLIVFDRFSLQNANAVVFATSGAGKSYTVKLEVLRSMMLGVDVIIIDPENEYKHLSDSVGGTFMNISLNSQVKINPFDLPKPVGGADRPADIIRSAVITIKGMLRIMLGTVTPMEDSILDRALIETYAKKDITPEADLHTIEPPLMNDFIGILEGFEGTENMVIKLKKYTEGTFAGLFNSPTNIETRNQLMVFSVRDLEDELRPIGIYMVVNYIWNTVRSELKKRILVIDEAWWLMQNEDSAKFIFALVKRCRKYYLGVTTITQDVNDFLRSQYGAAIVTNSAMQMLLKQSPAAVDNIQKTFMLTDGEKYLLLEGSVGQGIFFAGQKHVAMQVVASPVEDKIVTSDPRQLLEIENSKKEFKKQMQ
ncbi:MAG: conjugal transfer protein TraC [Candidatus Kerfeldbacteria bacterium CG15_BIG_FIL_POST_REV_8_21_14_020_45_12]|uniref:Conjugal transfer protein TraC n=1 Tax=Candidatus Kerfeldbacteria bacterium CG15_BIG_FIL_POST_REV_8_21_14_020_45_12 TaxID=2014247 RepID=A0A2M7H219_9BACT|nr:MAG: conjugal transfer protein TraC [Candidatus Kerfeldbacteria bacterium CG15_BIG_FIL_POST_REV_8_21_14_020_45_12]PJA92893.1 MAG: conjugal transfer protein TraC [Candidatus Kerfeldbacteria bacterium CG_4_9_14_3_um_filter_45_8]